MNSAKRKYDPELHFNHKAPWMTSEIKYLIASVNRPREEISFALGRTYKTVCQKILELRKEGAIK